MAGGIKRFRGKPSQMAFYVPPTQQTDFSNFLNTEVPNATFTFEIIRDWYARDPENPILTRVEYFPINWKSKVGNSDASINFKTDYRVHVQKGDQVINQEDGRVSMLNWRIQKYPNNQATQAVDCNAYLTFERMQEEKWNAEGKVVQEGGMQPIVSAMPAVCSEYAGRPDYALRLDSPGIHADALITVYVQMNPETRKIRLDDEFEWGLFRYKVININEAEIDICGEHGVLGLNARRVAGEMA